MLSGAVITVSAAAVVVVGKASKTPWGDLSINLATMIVGALLAASLAAVKRYADRLPERSILRRPANPAPHASDGVGGYLTPLAPARIEKADKHGLPETVVFTCNYDKFVYWGLLFLSLICVVGTVVPLFNPEQRSTDVETGQPVSDWDSLAYANAAVLFAYLFVPLAIAGLSTWRCSLRLEQETFTVDRRFRKASIPWSAIHRIRIDEGWLVATVDRSVEEAAVVHQLNGFFRKRERQNQVRARMHLDEVALASLYDLDRSKENRARLVVYVERFWGNSQAQCDAVDPQEPGQPETHPISD